MGLHYLLLGTGLQLTHYQINIDKCLAHFCQEDFADFQGQTYFTYIAVIKSAYESYLDNVAATDTLQDQHR